VVEQEAGDLVPQGPGQKGSVHRRAILAHVHNVNEDLAALDAPGVIVVKHGVVHRITHRHHGDTCRQHKPGHDAGLMLVYVCLGGGWPRSCGEPDLMPHSASRMAVGNTHIVWPDM